MLNGFVLEKSFNGQRKRSAVKWFVLNISPHHRTFFLTLGAFF
jgi:hypothetical protein